MPSLKSRASGVPGGFRYFQDETKTLIKAPHWWGLIDAVRRHRDANRIPLGQLEVEIEAQLAAEVALIAPNMVNSTDPEPAEPVRTLTRSRSWQWADVVRFSVTMVDSFFQGSERVTQDEANRRSGICVNCPSNVPVANCASGCGGLKSALSTALAKVAGGTTKHDDRLQACEFCGCLNRVQIWFPKALLAKHTPAEMQAQLPSFCWKGKDDTLVIEKPVLAKMPAKAVALKAVPISKPKPKGGDDSVKKKGSKKKKM